MRLIAPCWIVALALAIAACGGSRPAPRETPALTAATHPPAPSASPEPIAPPVWRALASPLPDGEHGEFVADVLDGRVWKIDVPLPLAATVMQWTWRGEAVVAVGEPKQGSALFAAAPGEQFQEVRAPRTAYPGVLSPDGRAIAFAGRGSVTVQDAASGDVIATFDTAGLAPRWSPGGRYIALDTGEMAGEVAVIDVQTGTMTSSGGGSPAWAWDDEAVAYVTAGGMQHGAPAPQLTIEHPGSGDVATVTFPAPMVIDWPAWSPRDAYLAVGYYDPAGHGFYIVDVTAGRLLLRVEDAVFGGFFGEDEAYFIGDNCGAPDVYTVRLDGGALTNVTASDAVEGSLHGYGGRVVYLEKPEPHSPVGTAIVLRDLMSGERRTVVEGRSLMLSGRAAPFGVFSKDRRFIAFSEIGDAYMHATCQDVMPQTLRVMPDP